jgi:hypothetical protein
MLWFRNYLSLRVSRHSSLRPCVLHVSLIPSSLIQSRTDTERRGACVTLNNFVECKPMVFHMSELAKASKNLRPDARLTMVSSVCLFVSGHALGIDPGEVARSLQRVRGTIDPTRPAVREGHGPVFQHAWRISTASSYRIHRITLFLLSNPVLLNLLVLAAHLEFFTFFCGTLIRTENWIYNKGTPICKQCNLLHKNKKLS